MHPLADRPEALADLLRPVYPSIREMLPVEDGLYVVYEWIGQEDYLKEGKSERGKRTRGANTTSADAMVMFRDADGRRQIVLIEWKYTESYSSMPLAVSRSGTDRPAIYRPLYERPDFPLGKDLIPDFEDLFYEPFYQLMRQQFLAHEMEKAHELGADRVRVLHIAPAHNTDFNKVTSPALRGLGESATGVWSRLVKEPGSFVSASTESLFGGLDLGRHPELAGWWVYVSGRYAWVTDG